MGTHNVDSFVFGTIANNRLQLDSSRLPGGLKQRTVTLNPPGTVHFDEVISKKVIGRLVASCKQSNR